MKNKFLKFLTKLLAFACLAHLSALAFAEETSTSKDMAIWIDVRTAEEFARGHVDGAINIPFEEIGKEISSVTRDIDADIRVYCRSGRRSGVAKDTLNGLGYENVVNEGGYEDILKRSE